MKTGSINEAMIDIYFKETSEWSSWWF